MFPQPPHINPIPPRSADSLKISLTHPHIASSEFHIYCANCGASERISLSLKEEMTESFTEHHARCPFPSPENYSFNREI